MDPLEAMVIAGLIVVFAIVSRLSSRAPVTMPMVFVAAGWLSASAGLVELDVEIEGVVLLSEVTLAVILFGDAVRLNVAALRRDVGLPARLLGIGLPLSVVLGAVMISLLIPDLSTWEAALVAAILAPTDAALGQAVVEDASVPLRIRQGLNVESGLNDGLVLPAVLLFLALATGEDADAGFWGQFAFRQIALGVVVGVAVGAVAGRLLHLARESGWVDGIYAQLGTLAVAIVAFTAALESGANGFLATFIAGLTFGSVMPDRVADRLDEYTEDTGRLLAVVAFFVFGNVLVAEHLSEPTLAIVACALATLTIGRILPVAVALADMRTARETVLFVGWFGPRGLASILFGLLLLEEELAAADELFAVISWTVLGSVVFHGATATVGARRYGQWWSEMEDEHADMPEGMEVEPSRPRWGR